jgi:hypothetical protein
VVWRYIREDMIWVVVFCVHEKGEPVRISDMDNK